MSPPTKAAGVQDTQRRSSQNMARADRAGASVKPTFSVATGPRSSVTGASGTPIARAPTFESRLTPVG